MGTRAVERGPAGEAVARNIRSVRDRRRLSQQQLAARLGELGRPVQASAIAKIESGDRRVDVDDLVALAVALNVSPGRLLLPETDDPEDVVRLVPGMEVYAYAAWDWATGSHALYGHEEDWNAPPMGSRELDFLTEQPLWKRLADQQPLMQAVRRAVSYVARTLTYVPAVDPSREVKPSTAYAVKRYAAKTVEALDDPRREMDRLVAEVQEEAGERG